MKTIKVILLALLMSFGLNSIAQVAINNDGTNANASAMLEIKSTDKGFLPPRMTETQRDNITDPVAGLQIFNSTTLKPNYYNGTDWMNFDGTSAERTVPDAPTIGITVAGNTEATVTFTAPDNNGGSAITSYTATSVPGSFTGTLTQSGSGIITVTGLTNYTDYTFTVTATNAFGTGAASAVSNLVTPSSNVTNSITGEIWMDRNLGATQVAISSTDAASYGDLYQWGRSAEGHQLRTSVITSTNATSYAPTTGTTWYGKFITESSSPKDWLAIQDDNLWQGVDGVNNPCPTGYRLPTKAEWEAERLSWGTDNAAGAYASPLKLPVAGSRNDSNGSVYNVGSIGRYWSGTADVINSWFLVIGSSVSIGGNYRANGYSVRCIKD